MEELNDAGTYFDLGPRQVQSTGIYNYLCTRNNNFSNRDQKGTIIVNNFATTTAAVGSNGGTASTAAGDSVTAQQGVFSNVVDITLISYSSDSSTSVSGSVASNYVQVPGNLPMTSGSYITLSIGYNVKHLANPTMYMAADMNSPFYSVSGVSFSGGTAQTDVSQGGVYVVTNKTNAGAIAGIVIAVLVVVGGIIFFVVYSYYRRKRNAVLNQSTANDKQIQKVPLSPKIKPRV